MTLTNAPVFYPTAVEFNDPLAYIDRLSSSLDGDHRGEGIFIIQPPLSWQPPCSLNAESFRFEARKQNFATHLKRSSGRNIDYPSKKYSLKTFKNMADRFKSNYFKRRMDSISGKSVEREFWKISSEFDNNDVHVQSAMNIRDITGFPRKAEIPEDERYVQSGWNLHNLAETNLLWYAKDGVAARNGTECNVEMCFSFASWATEDNWAYRVSYVHFGDALTWYATSTEDFDKIRKLLNIALKAKENDGYGDCSKQFLLSVSDVLESNVSVTRAVQSPRQFVVTLPRTYHAHISHGFNMWETLRVCTPGWLRAGMWFSADSCVHHIATSISYEELICRLLHNFDILDMTTLVQVYRAARKMLIEEAEAQNNIVVGCEKLSVSDDDVCEDKKVETNDINEKHVGINEAIKGSNTVDRTGRNESQETGNAIEDLEKQEISTKKDDSEISEGVTIQDAHDNNWEESNDYSALQKLLKRSLFKIDSATPFEIIPTTKRRCAVCNAICYLSDITCTCNRTSVCLRHADALCQCSLSKKTLRLRFPLQELSMLIDKSKRRVHQYELWNENVTMALDRSDKRLSLASLMLLVKEAQESNYLFTKLYKRLLETIRNAYKWSQTAREILDEAADFENRTRSSVKENEDCEDENDKDKNYGRLAFEDLRECAASIHCLPCILPETHEITLMLAAAVDIKADVEKLLSTEWTSSGPLANAVHLFNPLSSSVVSADTQSDLDAHSPDVRWISEVIRKAERSSVTFIEIPRLRELLEHRKWMTEVNRCLTVNPEHSQLTVDALRKLIEKGSEMPPHTPSERSLNQLKQLVAECTRLEDEAKRLRSAKHSLEAVEDLIDDARNVPVSLPSLKALKESAGHAREWIARVCSILTPGQQRWSYLGLIEKLIAHGNSLPVQLHQLESLVVLSSRARDWVDETSKAFLSKTSIYSLYEVLSPRQEIYPAQLPAKHRKQRPGDAHSVHVKNVLKDVPDCELPDAITIANLFREAEQVEVSQMIKLREINAYKGMGGWDGCLETSKRAAFAKSETSSPGATKYCVCAQSKTPDMMQCLLCLDYFHPSCLTNKKAVFQTKNGKQVQADCKFLCHLCMRSRRPKIETVLNLHRSLLMIPVRIVEGEALQSLAQRALDWQERVRKRLDKDDVNYALEKLNYLSNLRSEQAKRDKADRIMQLELQKAANVGMRQPDYNYGSSYGKQSSAEQSYKHQSHHGYPPPSRQSNPYQQSSYNSVTLGQMQPSAQYTSHGYENAGLGSKYHNQDHFGGGGRVNADSNYASTPVEHAYSTMSKHVTINQPQVTQRSHAPPPPAPVLELSEETRGDLEQLMLEGDLLEVSVEEAQRLWTILKACQPGNIESLCKLTGISEPSPVEPINPAAVVPVDKIKRQKRKQEMEQREELVWSDAEKDEKKPPLPKQRKQKEMKTKLLKKEVTESAKAVDVKKRKRKTTKVAPTVGKKQKCANAAESSSSNDEENCSAEPCRKPLGRKLDWVFCEPCQRWYHNICINVKPEDVPNDTDFVCYRCAH